MTNYVAVSGTSLVGSSAFTRNTDGTTRGDFALATQMSVHMANPSLQNWANILTFSKPFDHCLTSYVPGGVLTWDMPTAADELSEGTSPNHVLPAGQLVWPVQPSDALVIGQGDSTPYLLVKQYGKGNFIYHAAMQPFGGASHRQSFVNVKYWLRRADWELQSGLTAKLSAAPAS